MGFELRAPSLLGRYSTIGTTPSALLCVLNAHNKKKITLWEYIDNKLQHLLIK
jgi:hypothetical protein